MSGAPLSVFGVWGSSGTNVFAVGYAGTVLHYTGTSWSPMTSGTSESLYRVWGSLWSDVFAVGATGAIVHYDGTSWNPMIEISSRQESPRSAIIARAPSAIRS